ncbi:hypothetical protein [Rheinheimera sp.]|uniref:hypothetical protein n=1 Tax=Rheinheimera sp. TaxID=1869214 RepID=UPI003D29B6D9
MQNTTTSPVKAAVDIAYLPPEKAGNKRIFPVPAQSGQTVEAKPSNTAPEYSQGASASVLPGDEYPDKPGFGFNGGLLQRAAQQSPGSAMATATNQAVNQAVPPIQQATTPTQASATQATTAGATTSPTTPPAFEYKPVGADLLKNAPTMTVPTAATVQGTFTKDGYTGVQGNTNFNYKPSAESLVENRIVGLLDPNSALMRKAKAEADQYAASRGLQSSSIGGEMALSSMVDKAMPIATQDANTYNQAQQLGWQQSWQSGENNLGRTHDASMTDKQGQYQTTLQNTQIAASAAENAANRQMQAELQKLQYAQQAGLLDAQGLQRMQELNYQTKANDYQQTRSAQLQTERDKMLQDMSNQTMDKQYLQQLELTRVQYDQADKTFMAQLEAGKQAEYRNAVSTAYNNYLQQVGSVWADPNMTAEQKAAGAAYLQQQLDAHRKSLETLYLVTGTADTGAGTGGTGGTSTAPPTGTSNPNNPPITTNPVNGGGSNGGWKNGTQEP